MNNPSDLYSPFDWAELFGLCAEAKGYEEDTEAPYYIEVSDWLHRYSRDHDLPPPTEFDVKEIIKEAIMFLEKFAENHIDNMFNR